MADLVPLHEDVGKMPVWSDLVISLGPQRKINKGKHWKGLDCRFIIYGSGGSGGSQWRQIAKVGG